MRYLNWDILLFPGNSRIPLQEFDTKCHILSDQNDHLIDNAAVINIPHFSDFESMSQIPVLTSFVSSLEHGSPFRISVHNWEAPKPSQILRAFKSRDETVAFEARVYIDGNMVTQRIFDDSSVWPEVVESMGETNHTKVLRFPAFHPEILNQAHWEPGETYGRIRIVIAEGVIGLRVEDRNISAFDRLRDVVTFSFQHAPKQVLDHSGIAWPNARMFRMGARSAQVNVARRVIPESDFETHAHSPQRSQAPGSSMNFFSPVGLASYRNAKKSTDSGLFDDPFVGVAPIAFRVKQPQLRPDGINATAKDYSSVRTARSRALTEMSGVSYERPNFERTLNEAAVDEIVEALSPERKKDLLEALSPIPQTLSCNTSSSRAPFVDGTFGQQVSESSPTPVLPPLDPSIGTSIFQGNFPTFRHMSVPLMTPTMNVRNRWLSQGLHGSLDRPLPADSRQRFQKGDERVFSITQPELQSRSRSESNASKRKRMNSSGPEPPIGLCKIPSMSTSPCKRATVSPLQTSNSLLGDGGIVLRRLG